MQREPIKSTGKRNSMRKGHEGGGNECNFHFISHEEPFDNKAF